MLDEGIVPITVVDFPKRWHKGLVVLFPEVIHQFLMCHYAFIQASLQDQSVRGYFSQLSSCVPQFKSSGVPLLFEGCGRCF